jgi:hypothetical protein
MYDEDTHDRERTARLKTLAAQLARLPASRIRDELLREARHRTVMLDLGLPPSSAWRDRPANDPAARRQHMTLQAFTQFR